MNIPKAITYLYPTARNFIDFEVRDDSDGKGPYIDVWNVKDDNGDLVPKPTQEELEAAYAAWEAEEAGKPVPETQNQKIARLEDENAGMALELAESSIRLDASEQAQADLFLTLVSGGVI